MKFGFNMQMRLTKCFVSHIMHGWCGVVVKNWASCQKVNGLNVKNQHYTVNSRLILYIACTFGIKV